MLLVGLYKHSFIVYKNGGFNMFKENEIENARKYLIESHKGHNTGNGDFKYIKSTQKEDFKRLIFKKGTDNRVLYFYGKRRQILKTLILKT